MGVEIERKFLVKNDDWKNKSTNSIRIKQGYLNSHINRTVRVRIYGKEAFLTIKGKTNKFTRKEYEYPIPLSEATDLLLLCEEPLIEKTRYLLLEKEKNWELDVFDGINEGLIVAEIELNSENEDFDKPSWLGEEVSDDPRYYNSSLIENPYTTWH